MHRISPWLVSGLLVLASCADPALEQRVADLEAKLGEVETKLAEAEAGGGAAAAGPTAADETAAGELLRRANDQVTAMDYEGAKATLAELQREYPRTRAGMSSRRMSSELDVIGRDAGELAVEEWYVGNTSFDEGKATLVVFWEVWCPHCRREVPKIQELYETYGSQGLNIVGLTRLTKTSTEEQVREFIEENHLTYPLAKEDGSVAERMGVRGIPAAAVVKDGKVVWRGHPARINDSMIAAWLELPTEG